MLSLRVDEKIKKSMDAHGNINWSEIMRDAVKDKLNNEREQNLALSILLMEQIRVKASKGAIDTTEIIRKFRYE